MNTDEIPTSRVTVALAIVGFIALVGLFISLAVYSTRFVPGVVGRIGSAAVYLGSVFNPAPESSLSVIPNPIATTTIPFPEVATTTPATSTPPKAVAVTPKPVPTITIPQAITPTPVAPYGLPDLTVSIEATGYTISTSTDVGTMKDSFVASTTVPVGFRPAAIVTFKNIGTNWAATGWNYRASFQGAVSPGTGRIQETLAPGSEVSYILYITSANKGSNQMISITANYDHLLTEANLNNNSTSTQITILGN